jgi:hypothetical protein
VEESQVVWKEEREEREEREGGFRLCLGTKVELVISKMKVFFIQNVLHFQDYRIIL